MKMNQAQSRAFDRGNYCQAYETEDWETAYSANCDKLTADGTKEAFLLGFYSFHELHEIADDEVREAVALARVRYGEEY